MAHARQKDFPVVGVGASAGGLEAIQEFLTSLPKDTGMAFVIVPHLSAEHKSALVEILSRNTSMPVSEVAEKTNIEPNRIYIIPPNHNLSIKDGDLILEQVDKEAKLPRLPIDHFLTSLAEQKKDKAIGVILSGTGSDGTKGVQAIKAEGGITFAQDEESAKFSEMPRNAIVSGKVDYILYPKEIAVNLVKIKPRIENLAGIPEEYRDPSAENAFQMIIATLRALKGIDLSHYRRSTLNRRINRRMILRNVDKIEDYAQLLNNDAKEVEALFQDALINVTNFYRDKEAFDALKVKVFPNIVKDKDTSKPVRIWVPACSTGEEAYTIAMSLLEYLGEQRKDIALQIFATDINEQTIAKARIGIYGVNAVEDLPSEVLNHYFTKTQPGLYQVKKSIRDICIFAKHDVLTNPPFANMDLISCRNLLIYLDDTFQERIFTLFHYSLKNHGYLMLGKSESAARFRDLFEDVDKTNKIYVKKTSTTGRNTIPYLQPSNFRPERVSIPIREEERQDFASILQKETDRLILNELTPPGVVVNGEMDILQFRGKTGLFLEPASGLPSFNLMKMTRNSLGVKLRLGIERAKKDGGLVSIEDVEVKRNESTIRLDLEVRPFRVSGDKEMFYLIVFRESSAGKAVDSEAGHEVGVTEERNDGEITGLRKELDETRAYLQSYVEEKDRSNEELRSANEELQANFEELQSINEELQTAREELQASNEELRTVNEELAARNAEISDVYNVLENMINSSNLAMIMVDSSLRIRRVTPTARRVFKMIPSDVGRPLGDLKLNLRVPNLLDLVGNTLTTFTSKTMEVQDNDERWYSMSIQLYRTTDNKIDGAVVTFVDVDRLKRAEASAERLVTVLSQSNDAITTLNPDGRITAWNRGAEVMYGYAPYEAMGMNISALTLPGDLPLMIDALERVKRGEFVPPFKSRRITKTGKTLDVMLTLTKLVDGTGRLIAIASLESSLLKGFASPG